MSGIATAGNKIRGFEGQLYYTLAGGAETLFANVSDFDLTIKADSIDATDKSTTGWKDKEGGLKEWTGTIKANLIQSGTDVTNYYGALVGNTLLAGSFRPQDITGGLAWTGNFRVTNFKVGAPMNGMQTIDISAEGSGALTLGVVAAGGS